MAVPGPGIEPEPQVHFLLFKYVLNAWLERSFGPSGTEYHYKNNIIELVLSE